MADAAEGEVCASLPSSNTAADFVRGVPGSGFRLVRDWFFRALLIRGGMEVVRIFGKTPPDDALALSLAGSLGIEVSVLAYAAVNYAPIKVVPLPPVAVPTAPSV